MTSSKIAYVTWKRKSDYSNNRTRPWPPYLPNNSSSSLVLQVHLPVVHLVQVLMRFPRCLLTLLEGIRNNNHGQRRLQRQQEDLATLILPVRQVDS